MDGQVTGPFLRETRPGNSFAVPVAMTLSAGSPAKASCPTCHSSDVKVALDTVNAVYYLCSSCRHAWSARKPVGNKMRSAARRVPIEPDASTAD